MNNNLKDYDFSDDELDFDPAPGSSAFYVTENATNGDVIEGMFPYAQVYKYSIEIIVRIDDQRLKFDPAWWNAPYNRGGYNIGGFKI